MKRRALLICFAVCLFSLLVAPVFAHPGKTDSRGGHTNHYTGEYHYHHGYSAHDHYDIDGDGVADCPYDFDDKTNRSNSGAISSLPTTEATSSAKNSQSNADTISVFGWVIAIGVYVIIMIIFPILMSS